MKMTREIVILLLIVIFCDSEATRSAKKYYRNSFLLKADLSPNDAKEISAKFGLTLVKQKSPRGFHILEHTKLPAKSHRKYNITLNDFKQEEPKVELFHQEEYIERALKSFSRHRRSAVTIEDKEWNRMWNLRPETEPSMGVYKVWQRGLTGRGVVVAIIDDGADVTHPELSDSIDMSLSYNFVTKRNIPTHESHDIGHGTSCAGIVAAVKNQQCSVGIAYESKLAVLRVLDKQTGTTPSLEASAMIHHLDHVDIYSNSWGPPDTGDIFAGSHDVTEAALLEGITKGRRGLGAIYTWAAGNGGQQRDDCNCDSFVNSMYTIALQSVAMDTRPTYYAESCTAIMASTYSGDDMVNDTEIITSARGGSCRDDFHGTSASCATAAGIIALVLQANSNLTWRDVQHLIVETSSGENLMAGNFISNGAGKRVSEYFGFGLLNADAMVTAALNWTNVAERHNCSSGTHAIRNRPSVFGLIITDTYDLDCDIRHLEHVTVRVNFTAKVTGHLEIDLLSPQGTESKLLKSRPRDINPRNLTWTFMTLHNWGEYTRGPWTLVVRNSYGSEFTVHSWRLDVYGTPDPPTTTTSTTTTTTTSTTTTSSTTAKSTSTSSTGQSSNAPSTKAVNVGINQNTAPTASPDTHISATNTPGITRHTTATSGLTTTTKATTADTNSDKDATITIVVTVTVIGLVLILFGLIIYMYMFFTNTAKITPLC